MHRAKLPWICVIALSISTASASYLNDIEELKGKVVIEAGDVEEVRCPPRGKYDCNKWPQGFFRFSLTDVCFTSDIGACGYMCKGVLAVGEDRTPYFFEFERYGGSLKKRSVKMMQCPSLY